MLPGITIIVNVGGIIYHKGQEMASHARHALRGAVTLAFI